MVLWTIQPIEIYQKIMEDGLYRCDFNISGMEDCKIYYDWLVRQMKSRIGENPYVEYPVWAWHTNNGKRAKPDLRRERFAYGNKGEKYVCMEIDIPEEEVLLSDFDTWCIILLNGLVSESEEEDEQLGRYYDGLDQIEKETFKSKNWEGVFEIKRFKNVWCTRGENIQATFWELRKEQIKRVRYFTCV